MCIRDRYEGQWSGAAQLWWTGAREGSKLDLALPVTVAGQRRVVVALTRANDYGIVQLYLDGRKLGEPIDLYAEKVKPTGPIEFSDLGLTAGEHTLTIEVVGSNPKAKPFRMVGVDYVKLIPVRR